MSEYTRLFHRPLPDVFDFVSPNHPGFLATSLNQMRAEGTFCDLSICVGDRLIRVHRLVVIATIPYFRSLFETNMLETRVGEIKLDAEITCPSAVEALVNFVYTSKLQITPQNIHSLLEAACFFLVDEVVSVCEEYIRSHLCPDNVEHFKSLAVCFSRANLKLECERFIDLNLKAMSDIGMLEDLSKNAITELIQRETLHVTEEEEILSVLLSWIQYDPNNRKQHLLELIRLVRVHLLRSESISELYEHELVQESLTSQDFVRNLIRNRVHSKRRCHDLASLSGPRCYCHVPGLMYFLLHDQLRTFCSLYIFDTSRSYVYPPLLKGGMLDITKATNVSMVTVGNQLCCIFEPFLSIPLPPNLVQLYDLQTMHWTQLTSLSPLRYGFGFAAFETATTSYLYVCGGSHPEIGAPLRTTVRYNRSLNTWEHMADMNVPRNYPAVVVDARGQVYVMGGKDAEGNLLASVEVYSSALERWVMLPSMLSGRCKFTGVFLGHHLYVCGGNETNSVEVFDELRQKWYQLPPLRGAFQPFDNIQLLATNSRLFAVSSEQTNEFKFSSGEWEGVTFKKFPFGFRAAVLYIPP